MHRYANTVNNEVPSGANIGKFFFGGGVEKMLNVIIKYVGQEIYFFNIFLIFQGNIPPAHVCHWVS